MRIWWVWCHRKQNWALCPALQRQWVSLTIRREGHQATWVRPRLVCFEEKDSFTLAVNRFIKWNYHFFPNSMSFSNCPLEAKNFGESSWNKVSCSAHFFSGPPMHSFLSLEILITVNAHEMSLLIFCYCCPRDFDKECYLGQALTPNSFLSLRFQDNSTTLYCKV